ncbi:3-dehydroquinate dehydratase-2 [Bacilli bacterium PM5-3]|nr:3-dehydroquinate dehydratase-2 [Bacilli bacterium PM5-3]MDH6603829.1 3-dehydroquinate dehydratase-2 [Bacilli bacterium PM5-9]
MKLAIINGPNINMLGYRETEHYGRLNYQELINEIKNKVPNRFDEINFFQSNSEGKIIDYLHEITLENYDALIINPGAYAHYSYAIYDALLIFKGYKIEVHLSDVYNRDEFRKKLVTAPACQNIISGLGIESYLKALSELDAYFEKNML